MLARSLAYVLLVASVFLVGVPYVLLSSGLELGSLQIGPAKVVGFIPLVLGALVMGWCAWNFGSIGKGTPAPFDPPQVLVTRGLYRSVRNPLYLGAESILLGEAVFFESLTVLVYALALWILFHLFTVYYEEPGLVRRFGEPYERYREEVPRWIPRLKRNR